MLSHFCDIPDWKEMFCVRHGIIAGQQHSQCLVSNDNILRMKDLPELDMEGPLKTKDY